MYIITATRPLIPFLSVGTVYSLDGMGYDTGLQLKDPKNRKNYGLSETPPETSRPSRLSKHNMKADYKMTVSTGKNQQVAAPGELVKKWTRSGRNSDGGGEVTAARKPIYGADKITRFLIGISQKVPE